MIYACIRVDLSNRQIYAQHRGHTKTWQLCLHRARPSWFPFALSLARSRCNNCADRLFAFYFCLPSLPRCGSGGKVLARFGPSFQCHQIGAFCYIYLYINSLKSGHAVLLPSPSSSSPGPNYHLRISVPRAAREQKKNKKELSLHFANICI